jgi:hypothetical protein
MPLSFVIVEVFIPESVLVAVTSTPVITPPLSSVILPDRVAVSLCAGRDGQNSNGSITKTTNVRPIYARRPAVRLGAKYRVIPRMGGLAQACIEHGLPHFLAKTN